MRQFVSIIIPVKKINDCLRRETIPAILSQTYQDFEIIILPDKKTQEKFPKTKIIPSWPKTGPADKRDLGAKRAKGETLAFLDDDSFPAKDWLKNASKIFEESGGIAGVCGPALTPPDNGLFQKASGWVWSSWLGSGGAGTYRCAVSSRRLVDDFPTVNLLVRKKDFNKLGGFDSQFWPGEDTKLCLDLVHKLKKKIVYDPRVLVYHHRRKVFIPHLRQISRYALHRGHFSRILPETSLRIGYFIPTLFVLGLVFGPVLVLLAGRFGPTRLGPFFGLIWAGCLSLYGLLLLSTGLQVFIREKNLPLAMLVIPSIISTHLVYGALFIKGFLLPRLKSRYQR